MENNLLYNGGAIVSVTKVFNDISCSHFLKEYQGKEGVKFGY